MKLTYQAILDNPSLLARVQADARRERSQAVYRLLIAPLVSLVSLAFKAPHATRTHLARQG
jgi:hypothetical protein